MGKTLREATVLEVADEFEEKYGRLAISKCVETVKLYEGKVLEGFYTAHDFYDEVLTELVNRKLNGQ